jgi:hypothetical protein
MGREAICTASWNGSTAEVKALLESTEIILRGDIKVRIARAGIAGVTAMGDDLIVDVSGTPLTLALGSAEAAKWAAALLKAPPTLAEKFGLTGDRRAYVLGIVDDEVLSAAIDGATAPTPAEADMIIAVMREETELGAALQAARTPAPRPVWIVAGKGKFATVPDSTVRGFMREEGWIDTKTSAVSDRWTATRYSAR